MQLSRRKIRLGDGRFRHVTVLTDDVECARDEALGAARGLAVLRELLEAPPELRMAGPWPYQALSQKHDGARWVVELTAEGKEE